MEAQNSALDALKSDLEDSEEVAKPKQVRCLSKYYKPELYCRPGRLYRGEKKYRRNKTHLGKGKTLRDHRKMR